MNCAQGFAPGLDTRFVDGRGKGVYSSLAILAAATPAEAVLFHSPIDDERRPGQPGLPRLLVRDLGPQASAPQPAIVPESRPPGGAGPYLTYGYDTNRKEKVASVVPTNRLLIERRAVARPDYTVLLFPFRTVERPPRRRGTAAARSWRWTSARRASTRSASSAAVRTAAPACGSTARHGADGRRTSPARLSRPRAASGRRARRGPRRRPPR